MFSVIVRDFRCFFTLLLLLASACVSTVQASSSDQIEGEFLALSTVVQGRTLPSTVGAYRYLDSVLIHLGDFLDATEFQISANDSADHWGGWFFTTERVFELDLAQAVVYANGETYALEGGSFAVREDGLHIREAELERWFGVSLKLDQRNLRLFVNSRDEFAWQLREKSEAIKLRAYQNQRTKTVRVHRLSDQYHELTAPIVSYNLSSSASQTPAGTKINASAQLTANLDVLYHHVYYTRSDGKAQDGSFTNSQRMTVSRYSSTMNRGELVAGATSYSIGDVRLIGDGIGAPTTSGLGFYAERAVRRQQAAASQLEVVGDGTPGWEAHLYRSGIPIAFSTVGEDGRYRFDIGDVEINANDFEVHLLGLYGERVVKKHSLWAGRSELNPGEINWYLSLGDATQTLLEGEVGNADDAKVAGVLSAATLVGITPTTRMGFSWSKADTLLTKGALRTTEDYLAVSLEQDLRVGFLELKRFAQLGEGPATQARFTGSYLGSSYRLEALKFDGLIGATNLTQQDLQNIVRISVNKPQFLGFDSVGLNIEEKRFDRRSDLRRYSLFTGKRVSNIGFSHRLLFNDSEVDSADNWEGSFRASSGWKGLAGTFSVDYDYSDAQGTNWKYAKARLRARLGRKKTLELSARKSLSSDHHWHNTANFAYLGDGWAARVGAVYQDGHGWTANASVNFTFGVDKQRRTVRRLDRAAINSGYATLSFYRDKNGNGKRDSDEDLVPYRSSLNALYAGTSKGERQEHTFSIPAKNDYRVNRRRFRFSDADYMLAFDELSLYTHPGADTRYELPLVFAGEISGYVTGYDSISTAFTAVELFNTDGEVIASTKTKVDGFYAFGRVPPGRYTVSVTISQRDRPPIRENVNVIVDGDIGYAEVDIEVKGEPYLRTGDDKEGSPPNNLWTGI